MQIGSTEEQRVRGAQVGDATRIPLIDASALRISSARPSLKNSLSGSALRFWNGNTAIEGASSAEADSFG